MTTADDDRDQYDPRLRMRIWVAGEMLDEVWIDTDDPDAHEQMDRAQKRHVLLADEADNHGDPWLVEVYDPAAPPETAYVRFGTDREGMTEPADLRDAPREMRDLFLPGDPP